ncbi:MAG: YebC/PmpR family DNA-binding transcriptional regulator [Eubacteriaceae bacterium]|nr:YebC/PmpR family DNA-binding transcriptional regulator [Eubacteriaceae bacterium]
MSGHSKWATIKRKKGAADEKKGAIYTKLAKYIQIAAKDGADPDNNSKLKEAIQRAKAQNMPNDSIDRAIKKGSGETGGANWEDVIYEGYGIGGIAVIVEALTDNKNRTAGDVRHYFDKFGGNLGQNGCVSYMFDKKGVIVIDAEETDYSEDEIMEMALDAGADDMVTNEGTYEITTDPASFIEVTEALQAKGLEFLNAEVAMVPQNYTRLEDPDAIVKFNKMLDMFEENDDVQNVWHNADIDEE